MIVIDGRCGLCNKRGGSIYRMVGTCTNCGTKSILMLFSAGHEKQRLRCPSCGVFDAVLPLRMATEDEIPAAEVSA